MEITHRTEGQKYIIYLKGGFTHHETELVKDYIKSLMEAPDISGIVLNLKNTSFIDSTGIGVIAATYKALRQRDAKLTLCEVPRYLEELFRMTRLDQKTPIYADETEALMNLS